MSFVVNSDGKAVEKKEKKKSWMPNWFTWLTHSGIQAGCGVLFLLSGFSRKETAALLSAGMIWWVNREEEQDGIRSLDDYMDMAGPLLVTIGFWVFAFWPGSD